MWFDNAAFFTDFAVDVTINGVAVRGVFDNPYGAAFGGMVDGGGPLLQVDSGVSVSRGNTVVIGAATYTVTGVEPDGTGITTLRLDKA